MEFSKRKEIGLRIRRCRKEKKMKQRELAEKIGTKIQYVSMIEKGSLLFSDETFRLYSKKLASVLGLNNEKEQPPFKENGSSVVERNISEKLADTFKLNDEKRRGFFEATKKEAERKVSRSLKKGSTKKIPEIDNRYDNNANPPNLPKKNGRKTIEILEELLKAIREEHGITCKNAVALNEILFLERMKKNPQWHISYS